MQRFNKLADRGLYKPLRITYLSVYELITEDKLGYGPADKISPDDACVSSSS